MSNNILIVENDDIMLKAIRNILKKFGFNITMAKDGKEAFEMLENEKYDVVITDLMMPYANGLEIVSKLRSNESKRNTRIIVISAVGNEETISEAFRLGADEYIKKPITADVLLTCVRKQLMNIPTQAIA